MASLWDLPVNFVCENNIYSGAQRIEEHTKVKDIVDRAGAYAMRGEIVDGNDAPAVYEAVQKARKDCLSGAGPVLIECKTYRWGGHGTTDAQLYQPKDEIALWKERCPIKKLKASLMQAGALTEQEYRQLASETGQIVERAVQFAEDSPWPDPAEALEDVYA
jgi:pyruvate dehydrogenase E1 component alpha subunit